MVAAPPRTPLGALTQKPLGGRLDIVQCLGLANVTTGGVGVVGRGVGDEIGTGRFGHLGVAQ